MQCVMCFTARRAQSSGGGPVLAGVAEPHTRPVEPGETAQHCHQREKGNCRLRLSLHSQVCTGTVPLLTSKDKKVTAASVCLDSDVHNKKNKENVIKEKKVIFVCLDWCAQ